MLKVLYITNSIASSGGLERVLSLKASYLANMPNTQVSVLSLDAENAQPFYSLSEHVQWLKPTQPLGRGLLYLRNYHALVLATLGKVTPDVVCVCDDGIKGLLFPILIRPGVPTLYERHASRALFFNAHNATGLGNLLSKIMVWIGEKSASRFQAFVTLTPSNADEWKLRNLHSIPNPLPFVPKASTPPGEKIVLSVGNHGYHKGFDRLLAAWAKLSQHHPGWQLMIVGNSYGNSPYPELAKTLGIEKSVIFKEAVSHIEPFYRQASIYALSSRSEGFGMVLIEAMACGLPCVSFDCPSGPRHIIEDGADGFLISNGDVGAFARRLSQLMEDADLRHQFGNQALHSVQRFAMDRVMQSWLALFEVLARNADAHTLSSYQQRRRGH